MKKKFFSGCSLIEDFTKAEVQISFAILLLLDVNVIVTIDSMVFDVMIGNSQWDR
jgi:hypothetical protein